MERVNIMSGMEWKRKDAKCKMMLQFETCRKFETFDRGLSVKAICLSLFRLFFFFFFFFFFFVNFVSQCIYVLFLLALQIQYMELFDPYYLYVKFTNRMYSGLLSVD